MQTLTRYSLLSAVFITAALMPVAVQATQISADAGQFALQAQLVQNTCSAEFSEHTKGTQDVTVQVVLSGCASAPHVVSINPPVGNNARVNLGLSVNENSTAFESVYYINTHYLTSTLMHIEPMGATLQVTYF